MQFRNSGSHDYCSLRLTYFIDYEQIAGLRDEDGLSYKPSVVRVGLNAHHSVSAVTMDTLVSVALLCLFDSCQMNVSYRTESGVIENGSFAMSIVGFFKSTLSMFFKDGIISVVEAQYGTVSMAYSMRVLGCIY